MVEVGRLAMVGVLLRQSKYTTKYVKSFTSSIARDREIKLLDYANAK